MKLICYLSNGYPSIEGCLELAQTYVEAGCDVIEIDFPAKNPFLENEFIQNRMAQALERCADPDAYMDGLARLNALVPGTSFILVVYEATLKEIGYERLRDFLLDNGFLDIIYVGLESGEIKQRLIRDGIRVSCYVQYDVPEDEVEHARQSNGFVYLQARPTTGRVNEKYPLLSDLIAHLRAEGIDRPIYCGVGIHQPEDARMARQAGADAVFVGSTILKLYDDKQALIRKIHEFKAEC
ncbi:tryptophan synthase subunit alpha [Bacillota bacterium Meth-B3]|nr:tryptophan synthase subunit alpha [Christensenellaceae bacterium]MEA5064933.1 tryptophan synthase subunit alpha [Eubacteriales bacterium]